MKIDGGGHPKLVREIREKNGEGQWLWWNDQVKDSERRS
jgi:hypothetical protein